MKIAQSQIDLSSQRSYQQQSVLHERLNAWIGERPGSQPASASRADISSAGRAALAAEPADVSPAVDNKDAEQTLDPRSLLLKLLVEALTGRKIHVQQIVLQAPDTPAIANPNQAASSAPSSPPPAGYGVEYDRHEEYHEAETTRFSAAGVVKTADGQEIHFQVELQMTRAFHQSSDVSIRLGDAARQRKDPLVINFNGNAAQLTGPQTSLDLDGDGNKETFAFVGAGSGFLALDRNGNGRIDNGTELFGARSGDGFGELAQLDSDGNGWIDENDPGYATLKIWIKDADDQDQLLGLGQAKIGAIYLGSVGTDFALKDAANQEQGMIRRSGIYLTEDGKAGTVQKVDVTV